MRRDYRHVESDIVLSAPPRGGVGPTRDLLVYVLIEHESVPDRMMPLRLLDTRFGEIRAAILSVVDATHDVQRLDHWLDRIVIAESLNRFDFQP